jgi:hypothetical protein
LGGEGAAHPAARDAQVRQIGNDTCEYCEIIPLFDGGIEVVVAPKVIDDWAFSGWDTAISATPG